MSDELPLDRITVVSVEQAVAAPLATRLADLGARVIKVERPGTGDFARGYDETGLSSHVVRLNRSEESIALDLTDPAATGTMMRLPARADVFVQDPAPGAAARIGLEPGVLCDRPIATMLAVGGVVTLVCAVLAGETLRDRLSDRTDEQASACPAATATAV